METKDERKRRLNREAVKRYEERKGQEIKERKAQWYQNNKERLSEKYNSLEWKEHINEQRRKRYEINKEKILAQQKEYRKTVQFKTNRKEYNKANSEKVAEWKKKEYENNKEAYIARANKRKYQKLKATPKWLTDDDWFLIEEFYDLARLRSELIGVPFEVDHIVPIQGVEVCGLHCPDNLQILERSKNRYKSNKTIT